MALEILIMRVFARLLGAGGAWVCTWSSVCRLLVGLLVQADLMPAVFDAMQAATAIVPEVL